MEVVRRRRLRRGEPHRDVEQALSDTEGLSPLAALALFDDAQRRGDVPGRLQGEAGAAGAEAFRQCDEGADELPAASAVELVRQASRLAAWLRGQD